MNKPVKCFVCKCPFPSESVVNYKGHNYCHDCYEKKIDDENFSTQICAIFGLKAPGPKIYTQRKHIREKYGYTNQTIIDCLNFVFNVLRVPKKLESIGYVTPDTVAKMQEYQRKLSEKNEKLATALTEQKINVVYVPSAAKEKENKKVRNEGIEDVDWDTILSEEEGS